MGLSPAGQQVRCMTGRVAYWCLGGESCSSPVVFSQPQPHRYRPKMNIPSDGGSLIWNRIQNDLSSQAQSTTDQWRKYAEKLLIESSFVGIENLPGIARWYLYSIRVFHKHTRLTILALLPISYSQNLQFSSLFTPYDISKCAIKCQWV